MIEDKEKRIRFLKLNETYIELVEEQLVIDQLIVVDGKLEPVRVTYPVHFIPTFLDTIKMLLEA